MKQDEMKRYRAVDVCHIWGERASAEVGRMVDEIRFANAHFQRIAGTRQGLAQKAGFAAEVHHAETFNLDAILKDKRVRAYTAQHPESTISSIDSTTDILLRDGQSAETSAQLKYYRTAEDTQKALRVTRDGIPKYHEAEQHVVPSDQVDAVRESARKCQIENAGKRPQVADAAYEVEQKATGHLEHGGVQSAELSLEDAKALGAGMEEGEALLRKTERTYLDASTAKQLRHAAKSAAMIATVVAGTVNTVRCLKLIREGKLSEIEAAKYILWNTAIAAGDASLKAGAATATVSVAARTLPQLFAGSAFQTALASGGVAGFAISAVDLAECLVLVAAGRMTKDEIETRTGKNLLQSSSAVVGSAVGSAICAPAGPIGIFVGSLVGALITSLATTIAIDNQIEASYRETLATAEALVQSHHVLVESATLIAMSERAFVSFRVGVVQSEQQFCTQMQVIDAQLDALQLAIEKI
ncbi:hypothetical protein RDV84_22790 [Lysobacter yananisis]|uniref:Uncharacterized protein n=1 Tax=Lysobacter yananisis TaxID=1003114 RepID=A0ABY9P8S5_9GAMM|nr:hypothetical protein [Lysobacter yananisis]WMT02758.1 hypothetical protein RDV84_22790 [Lysobacter yananisis]